MMLRKRLWLYASPVLGIATAAILWTQILKPKVVELIAAQLPKLNASQDAVEIQADKVDLSLLKLQLTIYDGQVRFRDASLNLKPIRIHSASAQLDIFKLFIGQLNISKIVVDGLSWDYTVTPDKEPDKKFPEIPVETLFKYTQVVPVNRLLLYNTQIALNDPREELKINLNVPQLVLVNRKDNLDLSLPKVKAEIMREGKESLFCEGLFDFSLNREKLSVGAAELSVLDSFVALKAEVRNPAKIAAEPEGVLTLKSKVNLQDLRTLALILDRRKDRIPALAGFIETNGKLSLKTLNDISGAVQISTTEVVMDHFKLGHAEINATLSKDEVRLNEIRLEHPAGDAVLKNVKVQPHSPFHFTTQLAVEEFDLQKLFVSLGMSNVPAGLVATGDASCDGVLSPEPVVNCKTGMDVKDIWVKPGVNDKLNIVKLKQGHVSGDAKITKEGLSYQAAIQIGKSSGLSSGQVDFENGFDLGFETEKLDFDDVESLADLNFRGELKINGRTTGDSDHGLITANVALSNGEIDGFRVGNFSALLDYRDSGLKFTGLTGTIGKSDIAGDLAFDFHRSVLEGSFKSNRLEAEDLMSVLNKKFPLNFDFTGSGNANIRVEGPFNFWKLSYTVDSNFTNGMLAGEKYEKLDLNLASDGERINFRNVHLNKARSRLSVDGGIVTSGSEPRFDLKIRANPFLLEESDHVIRYAPSIAGIGYAEGQITGSLSQPEIFSDFTLKQVTYDKVEYPNSQGKFSIDKDFFKFNGQFFGRQIQSDIIWPWNEKNSFSAKVLIYDLNPLFLLPLVSIPQPTSDFSSKLNAEIDLVSKNRKLSSSDGYIRITDFVLRRGSQTLKLEKPGSMTFRGGLAQMETISLKGEDSFLNVKMNRSTPENVRLSVSADLQLRMFHFLVPFAQSLSGNLVIDSQIALKEGSFELFGEGELSDGLVSIKGFPQAIENINTPIEFSKSKIFLNDITGQLGQSDVTGVGHIDIVGSRNIVVNLKAVADNVELNFPDKVLTAGKATVGFTGNWLPYTLKIDYKVSHGLFEKDFEQEDDAASSTLRASSFLPPQQIEQLSPSLTLDVNVDLSKGVVVKNKLIEGEATGVLNISGTPETPVIRGRVDIKPGSKLIFKDKPFDIQTASIQFQQTREINPDLYISANSRVSDYDINLLVQGPAKNPSIKPTSQPPLSQSDIFSLLALGVTSESDQNLTSETQQKQTGLEVLASITNQSQLNKRIQEKLGLTLQLAPSVDSTKNIAVPKVVVSKKISTKLNASYSKPFTGNDQNQEIKLQYLYNRNISLLLNYQNKDTIQQDQLSNTTNNSKGILGLDLEFRDEFK